MINTHIYIYLRSSYLIFLIMYLCKVLEESGDWKGRSQQICILKVHKCCLEMSLFIYLYLCIHIIFFLKDKILELKAKLKKYSVPEPEYNQNEGLDSIYRKECEHMSANLMVCRGHDHLTFKTLLTHYTRCLLPFQKLSGL